MKIRVHSSGNLSNNFERKKKCLELSRYVIEYGQKKKKKRKCCERITALSAFIVLIVLVIFTKKKREINVFYKSLFF